MLRVLPIRVEFYETMAGKNVGTGVYIFKIADYWENKMKSLASKRHVFPPFLFSPNQRIKPGKKLLWGISIFKMIFQRKYPPLDRADLSELERLAGVEQDLTVLCRQTL